MNQGDRPAFSNGIIVLSVFAAIFIVAFRGNTQLLLPLYMIGVFVSFTRSQAGMVIHWRTRREPGWKTSALINGFGAVVTRVVLVIVTITTTLEGAWIVLLLIPAIIAVFKATRQHYDHVSLQVTLRGDEPQTRRHNTVLCHRRHPARGGRSAALRRDALRRPGAIYVDVDTAATEQVRAEVGKLGRARAAGRSPVAVPLGDEAAAGVHRDAHSPVGRLGHGDSSRVRAGAPVAAHAAQPACSAHQGRAIVPS